MSSVPLGIKFMIALCSPYILVRRWLRSLVEKPRVPLWIQEHEAYLKEQEEEPAE